MSTNSNLTSAAVIINIYDMVCIGFNFDLNLFKSILKTIVYNE
jgi:hypothetical protein